MVDNGPPDEELFGPLRYKKLADTAKIRKRGLLRRVALFASGVNVKLLDYVPSEETTYSVLGTCVIVTTLIATIASTVATGYLVKGNAYIGLIPIFIGLAFGTLIFALDRVLVKAPLNPYSFPSEVLHALWNPSSDARWYDVLSGQIVRGRPARRLREVAATFLKASPRFLIAIATSFVFAEITLFMIFTSEITVRAQAIQQEQQQQQIAQLNATYQAKRRQLQNAIDAEAGTDDPVLASLLQRQKTLQKKLSNLTSDITKLNQAQADEFDGIKAIFTLSNGVVIRTTGKLGGGKDYQALLTELRKDNAQLGPLQSRVSTISASVNSRRSKDESTNSGPIGKLESQEKTLDAQHATSLQQLESGVGPVTGVLIREQALGQLAGDMNPTTVAVNPPSACSTGASGVWCHITRFFVQPTPLGPFVASFRLFFISIELLPIIMKIIMSLRRRRPYDALVAAIEEVSTASSIELLDNQLVQVGAVLESRASWRKSQRSGTGAEFILAGIARSHMDNGTRENVLASALGRRFKSRVRLWPRSRKQELGDPPKAGLNGQAKHADRQR